LNHRDTGYAASFIVDVNIRGCSQRDHFDPARPDGLGNRANRGRIFGADWASAPAAKAVVHAARPVVVCFRVDRSWSRERVPAEFTRRRSHQLGELRSAQRRHRVFAQARPLEDVAALIDLSLYVAGLTGHAELELNLVVVRFELIQSDK
jgi:hypothetical protein